ncbi:hypothetical protein LP43_0937 [Methylophaga thiooxydans]|uniref:Uncharacterized protein n=1 Tax=Methylophaga thiooxydans TaxID=392484 RepID=A0A0A0BI28_9GAMM|nr:hypothetical protein LP43_0937 [Methylophaga thiooxydans]
MQHWVFSCIFVLAHAVLPLLNIVIFLTTHNKINADFMPVNFALM